MTYRKYNTYGRLRTVMLGSYFYPEFFSNITNPAVREPLMRMAHEVQEDLEQFENLLKQYGCQVLRAPQPTGVFDLENPYKPPLQVRDRHAVVGNKLYQTNHDYYNNVTPVLKNYCGDIINLVDDNDKFYSDSMADAIGSYNSELDLWYSKDKYQQLAGSDWPEFSQFVHGKRSTDPNINKEIDLFKDSFEYETKEMGPLQGPNLINTESTIYVDANEYCNYSQWLSNYINDSRPIQQFTSKAGHVDGVLAVLGPNLILGLTDVIDYNQVFPGYDVINIPMESYQHQIAEFNLMRTKVNGVWWLAGEEHNNEFINYVETYLKPWLGYVAESVFDVNVLPLDENTICVSNVTKEVRDQLSRKGIECILVSWRHRFFVDGGLHCITLDLNRD